MCFRASHFRVAAKGASRGLLALSFLAPALHAQWQMQDAHTTADLRGIDSVGNGVAWASGTNGTILRTEDAGFVWQLCAIPPGAGHLDFRGIQAFDNNTAIVMSSGKGDLSRLYVTNDGCQTWKLLFTNPDPDGFWDAVVFKTPNEGWLLGDPAHGKEVILHLERPKGSPCNSRANCHGTYLITDLEGTNLKAESATQGSFAASNAALFVLPNLPCGPIGKLKSPEATPLATEVWFAVGGRAGAAVYRQRLNCGPLYGDPQTVWNKMPVPVGSATESAGVFAIDFHSIQVDPKSSQFRGVAVGGDYLHPEDGSRSAAYSHSGGNTWTAAQTLPHGYRSTVAYDAAHNLWITAGPNGTDISTDDGRNWRPLKPGPNDPPDADGHWNALSLPFVVGPHGRIATLRPEALPTAAKP